MARMVPFPMLPTRSTAEVRLYEGFLEQLDDAYVIYHSVDWVLAGHDEGEADFVIAHPEDGLLALEVKGGRLDYDPGTRSWTQTGRDGRHHLKKDPFTQAKGAMHSLVDILQAQPGWDRWKPSFGFGLAFPDGTYEREAHPGAPVELVIDRDDVHRLAERVPQLMGVAKRPGRAFGAEGMDALATALGFRVAIRTPLKFEFDEDDRKIVELTDDQAWILAYIEHRERAAITGSAGCGKTLLAIQIAKRLAAKEHRTLLTCFNKRLADYLRAETQGVANLEVAHFHDLAYHLAKEAGLGVADDDRSNDATYFEDTLPSLMEEASRVLGPRYEAVVVDEAQDFREHWWPALLSLHRDPDDGILYVFADDDQNLYGGALPVGPEVHCPPLPSNMRNTRAIHEFVSVFHRGGASASAKGPPGRPPEILDYADEPGLLRLLGVVLTNLADTEEIPLEDIVILTTSGRSKSVVQAQSEIAGYRLSDVAEPGTVLVSSVHGFKGLERPVVILAEVGDRDHADVDEYLYVGGSRARHHLIVLATEPVARQLRERVRERLGS
ncbi:MAG: ATP-binding domain-containing protein [Actinomycetota bacterium]